MDVGARSWCIVHARPVEQRNSQQRPTCGEMKSASSRAEHLFAVGHPACGSVTNCLLCGRLALSPVGCVGVCSDTGDANGKQSIHCARLQDVYILMDSQRWNAEHGLLCDISLSDLGNMFGNRPAKWDTLPLNKADSTSLDVHIGITVFFRLLRSLQQRKNTQGVLKLIKQVPSTISNTPALSLSPFLATAERPAQDEPRILNKTLAFAEQPSSSRRGRVVDDIMSAAEELLCGEGHDLSSIEQGEILQAMVGLAVKRGSLAHCLRVVNLLFCSTAVDRGIPLSGVGHHIKELEGTQPCSVGDPVGLRSADIEGCEAGKLYVLHESTEPSTESECTNHCVLWTSSPPSALLTADLLKVSSTTSHHVALTAKGELLTWAFTKEKAVRENKGFAATALEPLSLMDRSRGVHVWRPRTQGGVDSVAGAGDSAGFAEFGHVDSACVWQVLYDRPRVKDVACGGEHTLAVLETGQVFSWGSGRNGRLGLEDVLDRTSACHVEALQGIDIDAVSCGVSHSMAICSKGTCYAWGRNNRGQCGDADTASSDVLSPRAVVGLESAPVAMVAGGREHTLALTRCGALFSFGGGLDSTGGIPPVVGISASAAAASAEVVLNKHGGVSPTRVRGDNIGTARVKMIASGWDHCLAVTDDGALLTWGSGRDGQLGHGDREPRHTPTPVAFFSTRAGGRVRSVAGGRSYSAAVTADGRVLKWGLNRKPASSLKNEHHRHVAVARACGRRNDRTEEDGVGAVEAFTPRLVAGLGVEGPRIVRLGEGETFGVVLVERHPALDRQPLPCSGCQRADLSDASTKQLLAGAGLSVPEDPSQPVGRVETALALLRHFERLATPHMPTDFTQDIERSVREVVRVGKRIQKRLQAEEEAPVSQKCCPESSSTSSADHHHFLKGVEPDVPVNEKKDQDKYAPICSVGKLHGDQEALAVLSRMPSPVVPFCLDPSWRTFRVFVDLIQGVRDLKRTDHAVTARNPTGINAASSSAVPDGKTLGKSQIVGDHIGPESCEEPSPRGFVKSVDVGNPSYKKQRPAPVAHANEAAIASRSVQMEVLRGALKILQVNLFHLIRVAAVRRACKKHGFGNPCSDQIESNPGYREIGTRDNRQGIQTPYGSKCRGQKSVATGAAKQKNRENEVEPRHFRETRSEDHVGNTSSTALHGKTLESPDQEQGQRKRDCAENVHRLMGELHAELQVLLEDIAQEDGQMKDAILAVQIEAAEAFRIGFSLFFPSNLSRVRLLLDVATTTTTTGSVPPERTGEDLRDEQNPKRYHEQLHRRVPSTPRASSLMMRLAVEGLARNGYAGAIVHGAFNQEACAYITGEDNGAGKGGAKNEIQEANERFDATKLDAVMQSLLSYCADNLHARLWGGRCTSTKAASREQEKGRHGSPCREEEAAGCPYSSLLLALQEDVVACWSKMNGSNDRKTAARGLTLAHTLRLLEESLQVFTRLLSDRDQHVGDKRPQADLTNAFMSLVPVLCDSWVALPAEGESFLWRAAALLPSVVPLIRAVDLFCRPRASTVMDAAAVRDAHVTARWLVNFEESLAMLCSDLVCGVVDAESTNLPQRVDPISRENGGDGCVDSGTRHRRGERVEEDVVELLMVSSPFLSCGRASFDWSGLEDECSSQPENHEFSHALEVIAFQEKMTSTACGCSSPSTLVSAASSTPLNRPHPQNGLPRGGRRVSHDNAAKLSPIDANVLPHEVRGEQSQSGAPTKSQGSDVGARREAEGKGGRNGWATGRQLHSIVDEARAEDFIQDLLRGQGAAAALYQWMTVTPEPQLPVLHAASLATQGQGWGSYQSLGSHAISDQQEIEAGHRRRRSRALPSDVDAATRALVAVMIKSNGVVVEAATFARCRLDRSSSPPRALKMVAAAAAEVRQVLAELADSLEGGTRADAKESTEKHSDNECHNNGGGEGGLHGQSDLDQNGAKNAANGVQLASATLANIVRNCRFLLTCTTRLPSVELARNSCPKDTTNYRRDRSYSRLPADDRRTRQELSRVFTRWTTDACNSSSTRCRPADESTASELALTLQHMVKGRTKEALSAAVAAVAYSQCPGITSLESLVIFAANPIPLEAIRKRMLHREMGAKARASGFRLIHGIINDVHASAARRQISTRLARSLAAFDGDGGNPALFAGIRAGGHAATGRVRAAYFDLFRHVLYEVDQEHFRLKSQDDVSRVSFTPLLVLLPLLRTLTNMLTPSLLCHASSTARSEELLTTSGARRTIGSTSPSPAPAAPKSRVTENKGLPFRAGRSSSCPSISLADASGSISSSQPSQESLSPLTLAIPVLGLVLSGHGDLLKPRARRDETTVVHHAAWQALATVNLQLCSSGPARAANRTSGGGLFESEQSATRRPASSQNRLERQSFAQEWWAAVEGTLAVLFEELVRARDCLEQLRQSTIATEEVLTATGAVQIVTGPVSVPLPATSALCGVEDEEMKDVRAVSFWVWAPAQPILPETDPGPEERTADQCSRAKGDELECVQARTIFTCSSTAAPQDGAIGTPERGMTIFLSQPSPRNLESTGDDAGGYYVGVYPGKKSSSLKPGGQNRSQRGDVGHNGHCFSTAPDDAGSDGLDGDHEISQDGEDCNCQVLQIESVFSKCPLRPGQWTHVCCQYSNGQDGGDGATPVTAPTSGEGGASHTGVTITVAFNGTIVANRTMSSSEIGCNTRRMTRPRLGQPFERCASELGEYHRYPSSNPDSIHYWTSERGCAPAVCDIDLHRLDVSQDQASQMASNGIPGQEKDRQRAAGIYVTRLVALADNLTACSARVVALLSSPRWLSLWFQLVEVAATHAKRAIVRLLRPLLCTRSQTADDSMERGATSKAAPGSPHAPFSAESDFSDRAVVHRLCSLMGRSLAPLLSGGWDDRALVVGTHAVSGRKSSSIAQDSPTLSEIVLLMRSLVKDAPDRWRDHVFAVLTEGLATAAGGKLARISEPIEGKEENMAGGKNQPSTWLGAAAAATYLGGGLIEGPRLGSRVMILPRTGYKPVVPSKGGEQRCGGKPWIEKEKEISRDIVGTVCMAADTPVLGEGAVKGACRGTVVGWIRNERELKSIGDELTLVSIDEQCKGSIDESLDNNPAPQRIRRQALGNREAMLQPWCRVVAVPRRATFLAEVTEPVTPFVFESALPSTLALLDSPPISRAGLAVYTREEKEPGGEPPNEIGRRLIAAHLRCRLLRAVAAQLQHAGQADAALRGKVLQPLLALGGSTLASAVVLALGSDGAVAFGRKRDFAAVILSLRHHGAASDHWLRLELESACQIVWARLSRGTNEREERRPGHQSQPDFAAKLEGVGKSGHSYPRPTLQVLGGDALVEGNRVTASSHFPTIRLSDVGVDSGSLRGRWYYEVTLMTGGLMQVGWAGPSFRCSPTSGQGVGDAEASWAFDGFRQKRWCVASAPYGKRWRAGDVVGVLLDTGLQEMRFSLNGGDLGVAFVGLDVQGLYPAASMNVGQAAHFNFGQCPFMYAPTEGGGLSIQPISEAVILTASTEPTLTDRARSREQSALEARRHAVEDDQVGAECTDDDAQAEDDAHARDGVGDTRGDAEEDGDQLEVERQALVETMIGMGFPVEWAIRAAGRSGAVMSESAATAWIIERLELENNKMEQEMGNMDTCEEDSADENSGVRDEYNDAGENDDGDADADASGFAFRAEAAGVERLTHDIADGVDEELGDRRWHDMYSAVRRSFLARSNGECPATTAIRPCQLGPDASAATGVATEAGRNQNDSNISPTTASRLRVEEEGEAQLERLRYNSHRLTRIAMLADGADLSSLSLVFDTALSILFARAAVVNLLTHAAGTSGTIPECYPYVLAQVGVKSARNVCPSVRLDPPATKGYRAHAPVVDEACRPSFDSGSWGGDWGGAGVATDVAHNLLGELTVPENQRGIVEFTKAFSTWHLPSRSARRRPVISMDDFDLAGRRITADIEDDGPKDGSDSGGFPGFAEGVDQLGLFPGSFLAAMRSLFRLVVASVKPWNEKASRSPESSVRRAGEGGAPLSNLQDGNDAAAGAAKNTSLAHLVRLFVHEAIATFEIDPVPKCAESASHGLTTSERKFEAGMSSSACGPLAFRSKYSWALWVLETLLEVKTAGHVEDGVSSKVADESAGTGSVRTASGIGDDAGDDDNSVLHAVASARSSQAFSAVLRSAISNDMGEILQSLAYSLCSRMLNKSRLTTPQPSNVSSPGLHVIKTSTTESVKGNTLEHAGVPEPGKYALPTQEKSLARAFSARLRSQVSTPNFSSHLLQSQLELLAQWELQRSGVRGEPLSDADSTRRQREAEFEYDERKVSGKKPQSPQVWVNTGRKHADSWDVATALFAGMEGGSDEFDTTRARNSRVAGRGRRTGTAESEASALSCLPTPRFLGKLNPPHHDSLLVEALSATSVTVSWGGWFESGDEPELQVGVGGDGFAYPVAFGKAGASDLAQALRSKLKHASSRRRSEGPSLVLKVSACGLWGSEPFHVAALDLGGRGCLKVYGLAADTRYSFRLERLETPLSQAPPAATADLSDDEHSCFPSAATVGANSVGGSSADQLAADATDCASALTGMDGSGGEGGGGASTCSEGCTTVLTDESRRQGGQASCCTSSTRAVAGRYLSPSSGDRYANRQTVDRDEPHWTALGGPERRSGASEFFVEGRVSGAIVASLSVATPPEVPFMLDAEGCGPNLRLSNSNLTVVNTGRKKWSAVRATRGFTCGVHRWEVRIDRCVSKNVFVGVMTSESRLDNYVGSDRSGWGYLANKAIWHNKGKVRSYGDLFREGDTIGVKLNMDLGTLQFARNGRDLGLAVQGLEGTLYPAFSMYNRTDQLTFVPQEHDTTPSHILSPGGAVDKNNGKSPVRIGGRSEAQNTSCKVIYGAFSAECVVRRAAKALEILGVLHDPARFASSPAGAELAENISSRLLEWSRGEHGRSVPSARSCAPVRLDTSEHGRRDLFGLGVGDRVLSAEGEATVLGATKHSLWVEVEPTLSSSTCSSGFSRGARAWDSDRAEGAREETPEGGRGHIASTADVTATSSPPHRRIAGRKASRIMPWSRCTVRQIFNNPEDYVVSRHETPPVSQERPTTATDDRHSTGQRETGGVVASTGDCLHPSQVRDMLLRWTRRMDEELEHQLTKLANSMAVASPSDLPFDALRELPPYDVIFPNASPIAQAEVRARAALLLDVNDLVLPLLPLVDTSSNDRGPLSMLIHKCRHLVFQAAKLEFLDSAIGPNKTVVPLESGSESAAASTIRVSGVKALPSVPTAPLCPTKLPAQSWAHTWREVDKSVFGQVAKHLSCSPKHVLSEGPMAFLVELVDASMATEDEDRRQLADALALYRGVFWQVCVEVFSPPISMFVPSPSQAATRGSSVAPDLVGANIGANTEACDSFIADHDAVPNPLFASDGMTMDPGRVSLYRSFGYITGLAVRTGVPLPLSHISSRWWMLVSGDDVSSSANNFAAAGGGHASGATSKAAARGRSRSVRANEGIPSDATQVPPPLCAIDEVLMKLSRLEEAGLKKEELDELLADARFVSPLSNGLMAELLPGGLNRPVAHQNLGEYRTRLTWLQASEYAPQASAFRAGLEDALPKRLLSLLTWRQMEALICG